MFTNSHWFAFQENGTIDESLDTSSIERMDEIDLNGTALASNGGSSSDDEVVVGEDGELVDTATSINRASDSGADCMDKPPTKNVLTNGGYSCGVEHSSGLEKPCASHNLSLFQHETTVDGVLSGDQPLPDWVTWRESSNFQVDGPGRNHLTDNVKLDPYLQKAMGSMVDGLNCEIKATNNHSIVLDSGDGPVGMGKSGTMPSLFGEDVKFVGVDLEGTKKAMEQALKEGIVGEASC